MSYESKIAQIIALVENLNKLRPDNTISIEKFKKELSNQGVVDESSLSYAPREAFENAGLPFIQAKQAADIARASDNPEGDTKSFVSAKRADRMNVRELVQAYDPKDRLVSPVFNRLKTIAGDARVVVYNQNGTINVDLTVQLINEHIENLAERESINLDGRPVKTYKLGEKRDELYDENPFFAGEVLRTDGTCQRTEVNWLDVPLNLRQIVYLAVNKTGELYGTEEKAYDTFENITDWGDQAEKKLRGRYRKASIMLDSLVATGQAPTLRIAHNSQKKQPTSRNDPFGNKRF